MSDIKTIANLNELLEQKNEEIESLRERVAAAENKFENSRAGWCLPVLLSAEQTLPVPRLELLFTQPDEYTTSIVYRLVYRHHLGHCEAIIFSRTIRQGSGSPVRNGKLNLPTRDGAHIINERDQLKLPAFAVFEAHVEQITR